MYNSFFVLNIFFLFSENPEEMGCPLAGDVPHRYRHSSRGHADRSLYRIRRSPQVLGPENMYP